MTIDKKRMLEIDEIIYEILLETDMSFPRNSIGQLLQKLNIQYSIRANLPQHISGLIFIENNIPKIAVNEADSIRRRVFSLAHELAHYKLDHIKDSDAEGIRYRLDLYNYYNNDSQEKKANYYKEEKEANYFAASLLVPKNKLIETLSQTKSTEIISDYFGVSSPVIEIRKKELGIL